MADQAKYTVRYTIRVEGVGVGKGVFTDCTRAQVIQIVDQHLRDDVVTFTVEPAPNESSRDG